MILNVGQAVLQKLRMTMMTAIATQAARLISHIFTTVIAMQRALRQLNMRIKSFVLLPAQPKLQTMIRLKNALQSVPLHLPIYIAVNVIQPVLELFPTRTKTPAMLHVPLKALMMMETIIVIQAVLRAFPKDWEISAIQAVLDLTLILTRTSAIVLVRIQLRIPMVILTACRIVQTALHTCMERAVMRLVHRSHRLPIFIKRTVCSNVLTMRLIITMEIA